jgi:Reverse transcriptase (RNA-dependent DNA polymerase)
MKADKSIAGELQLAWRRTRADMGERGFVLFPNLAEWIEVDEKGWLADLKERVCAGYEPEPASPCYEPKANWMLRPGAVLRLDDEIVYNLLLGRMLRQIWEAIGWAQGDPDLAYSVEEKRLESTRWVVRGTRAHKRFRELSLDRLAVDVSHVVTTDITGFYENIDIDRLISDLRAWNCNADDLVLLNKCLRRWAFPRSKGLPQGHSASDILAKVYVNPIDQTLRNEGIKHLRYVDDIRIFCASRRQAKIAIYRLTELMSVRGLNLQSAKTKIRTRSEAETEFRGAAATLEDIEKQLATELQVEPSEDEYQSSSRSFKELRKRNRTAPVILERTFKDFFPLANEASFDKSLFHFLLGRLAAAGSVVAVDYCLAAIRQRPEETFYVLQYLADVRISEEQVTSLIEYMESEDALYDHQLYQMLRWFIEQNRRSDRILGLTRRWLSDQNRAQWLRVYAIYYLGAHGDKSDLERLESTYGTLATEIEKASCIEALSRLEIGRRNSLYARIAKDGRLVSRAVTRVRSTH